MPKSVHLLVFDGFADWEPAHAVAELRRWGKREVTVVGFGDQPVMSMGGMRVVPDQKLTGVNPADVELFILPGGDMWEGAYPRTELESLLHQLVADGVPVAAICGATLAFARAGLLDERRHTSNMPTYIAKHAPAYRGHALYDEALAVRDRGVITASGLGDVDFARAIFAELKMFSPSNEALWFDMFKHGRVPRATPT